MVDTSNCPSTAASRHALLLDRPLDSMLGLRPTVTRMCWTVLERATHPALRRHPSPSPVPRTCTSSHSSSVRCVGPARKVASPSKGWMLSRTKRCTSTVGALAAGLPPAALAAGAVRAAGCGMAEEAKPLRVGSGGWGRGMSRGGAAWPPGRSSRKGSRQELALHSPLLGAHLSAGRLSCASSAAEEVW